MALTALHCSCDKCYKVKICSPKLVHSEGTAKLGKLWRVSLRK